MIDHARKTFMGKHDNLAFLCLDAREMDFEPEFDIVFSNATLHWVRDHLPVLEENRTGFKTIGKGPAPDGRAGKCGGNNRRGG